MRNTITKNCAVCGNPHEVRATDLLHGKGKYCSLKCNGVASSIRMLAKAAEINLPNVTCAQCGKKFYMSPSKKRNSKSGLFFCCRHCKNTAQRIGGIEEIMPPHYGTATGLHSYREIAFACLPNKCNICGYNEIPEILQVHHKSRDRTDNTVENLQILCPTCHQKIHFLTKTGLYRQTKNKGA